MMVVPRAARAVICRQKLRRVSGSIPDVGSSRKGSWVHEGVRKPWKAAAYIRPGGHQPYGQDNRTSKIHG